MIFCYMRSGKQKFKAKTEKIMRKKQKFAALYTTEGEKLKENGGMPHSEYPRPRMVRDSYLCLNGEWDFGYGKSEIYDRKILVPFPPQSLLSGIKKHIPQSDTLFYSKKFHLDRDFCEGKKVLLHIGAADQRAEVFLNGKRLGEHIGGYSSFSFDITEHISDENELKFWVKDKLDSKILPYGKQCEKRGGMWYTPVSGIWQTVWLEAVPERYIIDVSAEYFIDRTEIEVKTSDFGGDVTFIFEGKEIVTKDGRASLKPDAPELWSPENPRLYDFEVVYGGDKVSSYFALRSIETKNIDGTERICLNGKPYFLHGLLDQGYFSDGIFTPASPACFSDDIMLAKRMGFNTLRKHIKAEPELFYYYCDKLGMIVMQDLINNGSYSFIRDTALPTVGLKWLPDRFLHPKKAARNAFIREGTELVDKLKNHPSVLYFTVFNEGWGQFDSDRLYKIIKHHAPHHMIDTASGWFRGGESDVISPHVYFKKVKIKKGKKPILLSEFGGYSYSVPHHAFNTEKVYGYKLFGSAEELEDAIVSLYENEIIPALCDGLCGAILTQLSDVEDETNGLITYDRKKVKLTTERMRKIAEKLCFTTELN